MPTTNVLTQLVGLLFAAFAAFHIVLPPSFTESAVAGAVLLVMAAASLINRLYVKGETPADAKVWYQSKTLWVAVVAAIFGVLGLFDIGVTVDQGGLVATILTIAGFAQLVLHKTSTTALTATPAAS